MLTEIFVAVIVIQFLATFNSSLREDVDSSIAYVCFAVRLAGVVYIARFVTSDVAIYHGALARLEEIFASIGVLLFF